jgi:hypothetical protein
MTLHDAERDGWIREFDSILVRVYPLAARRRDGCDAVATNDDGPTRTVLEPDSDDDDDETTGGCDDDGADAECGDDRGRPDDATVDRCVTGAILDADDRNNNNQRYERPGDETLQRRLLFEQRIHAIFQSFDENANVGGTVGKQAKTKTKSISTTTTTTKKKKPVSKQVRNMMIKSKSTGNPRLKQEDRVYLQVVLLRDNDDYDMTTTDAPSSLSCSASYRYFSKRDNLRRIVTTVLDGDTSVKLCDTDKVDESGFECIVRRKDSSDSLNCGCYRALPTTLMLGDAIDEGFIENFGSIIIAQQCRDPKNTESGPRDKDID